MARNVRYTIEDVEAVLVDRHQMLATKDERDLDHKALNWRGKMRGFNYWGHFVQLDEGWFASFEDICEYCIHQIVAKHGTRADRLRWIAANAAEKNPLSPEEYPMPVSRKEIARARSRRRRQRIQRTRALRTSRQTRDTMDFEFADV